MYNIIRRPLVTEKNTSHGEVGIYAFEVQRDSNKAEIRKAVERAFQVKVLDVRTMVCRSRSKRTRFGAVRPVYWKKALVKLAPGEKITLFEGV